MHRCDSCFTTWTDAADRCPTCGGKRFQHDYEPSPLEDDIRVAVRTHLAELRPAVLNALKKLAKQKLDEETYLISFEAHPGEFRYGLAVRWDAMDEGIGQLDDGDSLFDDDGPLIADHLYDLPDGDLEIPHLAFHELPEWFADCWLEAGGAKSRDPAYLNEHGSSLAYDLVQKRWDYHGERWPEGA